MDEARGKIENIIRGRSVDQARIGLQAELDKAFEPHIDEKNLSSFWDFARQESALNDDVSSDSANTSASVPVAALQTNDTGSTVGRDTYKCHSCFSICAGNICHACGRAGAGHRLSVGADQCRPDFGNGWGSPAAKSICNSAGPDKAGSAAPGCAGDDMDYKQKCGCVRFGGRRRG